MKKFLFSGLATVIMALTSGCSEDSGFMGDKSTGSIRPDVALNSEVLSRASAESRAVLSDISVDDLTLNLVSEDGSESFTYPNVNEFPVDKQFNVGTYTLSASYGNVKEEGFDKPYLYGETQVLVKENQESQVSLTACLANSIIEIAYTDNFKKYFEAYSSSVTTINATHFVAADETRQLYVAPGAVTPAVTYSTPQGERKSVNGTVFNAVAKTKYVVTFDLNQESGKAFLVISYSDNVDVEDVIIDLSEDLENAPAPVVETEGFTPGTALSFVESAFDTANSLKANIIARAGISSVVLQSNSVSLRNKGIPESIELVNADAATVAMLSSVGFDIKGLFKNPDAMAIVDFAGVMNALSFLDGGGSNENSFTLTVTDRIGRVSEPVTLTVNVIKAVMEISQSGALLPYEKTATFALNFNGGNPQENIKFEVKNERKTWDVVSATVVSTNGDNYSVTVPVKDDAEPVTVRATFKNISQELTLKREIAPYTVNAASEGAFATYVKFPVSAEDGSTVPAATLRISENGGEYLQHNCSIENNVLSISGLKPSTEYSFYLVFNGIPTLKYSFTTEDAIQIPGSNFDEEPTIADSGNNWEEYVFPNGWGTNNNMTTHPGSINNFAYDKISGTKPATGDNAKSGSAIAIRTNGWGPSNTALSGVSGACKYIDPGLFHLGANRTARPDGYGDRAGSLNTDDLECGISFASRPSSVSFWFKYAAKNSADHGEVLIQVLDNVGNIIAQATESLGSQGDYDLKTIPLNYSTPAPKAGKIYIRFLSTNVPDALTKNSSWLNGPGFANLSRGEYSGSTLYVDELSLNY